MFLSFRGIGAMVIVAAVAFIARADDGTSSLPTPTIRGGRRMHHQANPDKPDKVGIKGQCVLQKGPNNLVASPCVDLVLILQDMGGNEVLRARTDAKGAFDFTPDADKGDQFLIGSGSRLYEIALPKEPIKRGQILNLQVRIK